MIIALVLTVIVLYAGVVWQQSKLNAIAFDLQEVTQELASTRAKLNTTEAKYQKQSSDTSDLVVAITPLIEQTSWLGPQPYGTGLPQLQAMETRRNQQIVAVRSRIMNLPVVQDHPKQSLLPKIGVAPGT